MQTHTKSEFGYIPILNTQKIWVLVLRMSMGMCMISKKIVYWVLGMGIGMIPKPNTHTQYTQFLGTKYNFWFGYPNPDFLCVNVWSHGKKFGSFFKVIS